MGSEDNDRERVRDIVDQYNSARLTPAPAQMMKDAIDEVMRLRAENEKLREALKPFAAAIVSYDDPDIDGGFTIEWDIYPKDLEAARKALGTEE